MIRENSLCLTRRSTTLLTC